MFSYKEAVLGLLYNLLWKALTLRYYATFKVKKFGSLLYKINTCLQKTTSCIGLRAEEIFSVNI